MLLNKSTALALIFAASIAPFTADAAVAPVGPWLDKMGGHESGGTYDIVNPNPGQTAAGRFQIIAEHWEGEGYITFPAGKSRTWDNAVFTQAAKDLGVHNYNDFVNSPAGMQMQNNYAAKLAHDKWNTLTTNGAIDHLGVELSVSPSDKNPDGLINVTPGGMLAATWMAGPTVVQKWAEGGFTTSALKNSLSKEDMLKVLKANSYIAQDATDFTLADVEKWQAELMKRMEDFEGVDISDIVDGVPDYSNQETMVCDTYVSETMQQEAVSYVEQVAAGAQSDEFGFSQLDGTFGELSCIEFAFSGGLDVMFSVPNLNDLKNQAVQMACDKVNSMVSEATGNLTSKLTELTSLSSDIPGFGPFQNIGGVSTAWNPNTTGINVGTTDATLGGTGGTGGSAGGGAGIGGPATFNPSGTTGLEALFEEGTQ